MAARHGLKAGEIAPGAALEVKNVYCLGNCALGPAAMLDGKPVGRLDEARVDALVAETRR